MLERLQTVRDNIAQAAKRAGRNPDDVRLIAVSKTRTLEEVITALECGQKVFGENQIQDALTKIPHLSYPQAEWHMIGHLQSKKAKDIPANFQWLHTLDSFKLAEKLNASMQRAEQQIPLNCLLQANLSGEASKSGLQTSDVIPLIKEILAAEFSMIKLRGLMTIGVQNDEQQTRTVFAELRELKDKCRNATGLKDFDQLSMGMSSDYEIAIEEGATMVRVGTGIFGPRH